MAYALTGQWIAAQVAASEYVITLHADVERRNDGLSIEQLEDVLRSGELIERYPDDPRGPSALVLGVSSGQHVHVVCGRNSVGCLVIITVYIPTLPKWKSPRERNR